MGERRKTQRMPGFKFPYGSLHCKSEESEVHDPSTRNNLSNINTKKPCLSRCSRSISNIREVLHGSKRHVEKPYSCSPRSLVSIDFVNPIRHEVILDGFACEFKVSGLYKHGIHGPGGPDLARRSMKKYAESPVYFGENCRYSKVEGSFCEDFYEFSSLVCKICCVRFKNLDAIEAHHLSNHAVTELVEWESSRRIVEIIFNSNWLNPDVQCVQIDRVLKVHNMQTTIAQFEEQREMVKIKASKLATKHPRCLADGNELLRFYGSTVCCPLGINGSSNLCKLATCGVCQILRNGFTQKDVDNIVGVYTTSTSGRAFESIAIDVSEGNQPIRKALLVCRVIAGRVHKPVEKMQEMAGQVGFDSLAGKASKSSEMEELYVLNSKALLPCFVVICRI